MKNYGAELFFLTEIVDGMLVPLDKEDKDLMNFCEYYNEQELKRLNKIEKELAIRESMGEIEPLEEGGVLSDEEIKRIIADDDNDDN